MTMPLTFANMLDDAAVLSLEHQLFLVDLLGENRYSVDLEEPRFEFIGDHPLVCRQFHLLGSAAPGPQSWLWSWANPGGYSPAITGLAAALAEFGRAQNISELARPEIPFSALPTGPTQPLQVAGFMIDVAKVFSGRWFAFTFAAEGGTRASVLLEHPELVLPSPDPARVMRVINQAIGTVVLHDHRRALHSYAIRRPLDASFNADYTRLTIAGPRLAIEISFDMFGRATDVKGDLGPS